jgi:hypothetical protein
MLSVVLTESTAVLRATLAISSMESVYRKKLLLLVQPSLYPVPSDQPSSKHLRISSVLMEVSVHPITLAVQAHREVMLAAHNRVLPAVQTDYIAAP